MRAVLLMLALIVGPVAADGIQMTEHHRFVYKRENCYTMKLTMGQIAELETKRKGEEKLYANMKLTKEQAAFLKKKTGKIVTKVLVFEKGWNDCSCGAQNIASRFQPDQIEVSDTYLVDEEKLRKWEEKTKAAKEEKAKQAAAEKKAMEKEE